MARRIICVATMVMLIAATTNYADAKDVVKSGVGAAGVAAAGKAAKDKAQNCSTAPVGTDAKGKPLTAVACSNPK